MDHKINIYVPGFIVMEPGPTAEPRQLNTSLLRLLKVDGTLGEPKSCGLNWNRRDMYIRNGMHCNNTGSRCSYMSSQKRVARHFNYKGKEQIVNLREMKLVHRNFLDLNEKTCFQAFRPCKTQTNLLSYRDMLEC